MGNCFTKGFAALILIIMSFLVISCEENEPGTSNDPEATAPMDEGTTIEGNRPYGLLEDSNYLRQVAWKGLFGYDAYLDMETFRPAQPEGRKTRELTEDDIQALAAWRSPEGVPWTTWAYEKELTLESHETFAIRREAAGFVITDEVYATILKFLLKQKSIEDSPEVLKFFIMGGEVPEIFTGIDEWDPYFTVTRWFRENVSAMATEPYTAIVESYAWYTSPGYEKGSMPEELEAAMDLIGAGNIPEHYWDFGEATVWANRASEIIKSGEITPPNPPYYTAGSDHEFFRIDENIANLGYYKDLLEIISLLEENPENFLNVREHYRQLIEKFPAPEEHFTRISREIILEDFEFLEQYAGTPDEEIIRREGYTDYPLSYYRGKLVGNLLSYRFEVEAFIRTWSELQSSGD